jgi:hypothetical protein
MNGLEEYQETLQNLVLSQELDFFNAMLFLERTILSSCIKAKGGNITRAARALGMNRQTLSAMLDRRNTSTWKVRINCTGRPKKEREEVKLCEECRSVATGPSCSVCEDLSRVLEKYIFLS